jgi:aspartate aminotransferase-like enzyme
MNRRDSVAALMAMGIAPLAAQAQQKGKVYRIGYLSAPTRASREGVLQAFLRALRQLGWVEARTSSSSTDGPRERSSACQRWLLSWCNPRST